MHRLCLFCFSSGGSFSASDISASTLNDGEGGGYVKALRVQFPSTVDLLASKVSSPHCLFAFLLVVTAILRGGSAERPLPAPQLNFAFYNIFFLALPGSEENEFGSMRREVL